MSPAKKSKPGKEVVIQRVRRICAKLPEATKWPEIEELLTDAWRLAVPKKLADQLE